MVVHPQSVIHSMVEFEDGAVKASLGVPDMSADQYAYPKRESLSGERVDSRVQHLTFENPDTTRLQPGSGLRSPASGRKHALVLSMRRMKSWWLVFLKDQISFLGMREVIENPWRRFLL